MKFLTFASVLMILVLPLLIFLSVFKYASYDQNFYEEKFMEYGVKEDVPNAELLHKKIIEFVSGKSQFAPSELNDREQQHLFDVRRAMRIAAILFYSFLALFALLLYVEISISFKTGENFMSIIGKVMVFGGLLTIALASILLALIALDFSASFDSFHKILFDKGTYVFNPENEVIVRIYPEQIFQDIGARISKDVIFLSITAIVLGALLMLNSKQKKWHIREKVV